MLVKGRVPQALWVAAAPQMLGHPRLPFFLSYQPLFYDGLLHLLCAFSSVLEFSSSVFSPRKFFLMSPFGVLHTLVPFLLV